MPSSRGSSRPRHAIRVPCVGIQVLYYWATSRAHSLDAWGHRWLCVLNISWAKVWDVGVDTDLRVLWVGKSINTGYGLVTGRVIRILLRLSGEILLDVEDEIITGGSPRIRGSCKLSSWIKLEHCLLHERSWFSISSSSFIRFFFFCFFFFLRTQNLCPCSQDFMLTEGKEYFFQYILKTNLLTWNSRHIKVTDLKCKIQGGT